MAALVGYRLCIHGKALTAGFLIALECKLVHTANRSRHQLKAIKDMTSRERWIMAPLVAMTLLLGVYPSLITDLIGPSVAALIDNYQAALPTDTVAAVASH